MDKIPAQSKNFIQSYGSSFEIEGKSIYQLPDFTIKFQSREKKGDYNYWCNYYLVESITDQSSEGVLLDFVLGGEVSALFFQLEGKKYVLEVSQSLAVEKMPESHIIVWQENVFKKEEAKMLKKILSQPSDIK